MAASEPARDGTPLSSNTSSQAPILTRKTTEDKQPAKNRKLNDIPTVVDITEDPAGDMVIKVGKNEDARLVRVHSNFLRLGSDVFRAMLSTRYAEGSKTFTTNDPLVLEDDDPDAFIKLCKVLHYQFGKEDDLKVEDLPGLAVLADKYAATKATKTTFISLLGLLFGPSVLIESDSLNGCDAITLSDLICIAYIIDDAQLFWRATRSAIAFGNGSDQLYKARPDLLNLVSGPAIEMLQDVRILELDKLENLFQTPFYDTFQGQIDVVRSPPYLCSEMKSIIANWTYSMWSLKGGFRPIAETSLTLVESWHGLECNAREELEMATGCSQRHQDHYPWDELMSEVLNAVEKSKRDLRGLCLQCVREQASEWKDGCGHSFEK